jgi:hypothetical protein
MLREFWQSFNSLSAGLMLPPQAAGYVLLWHLHNA